MMHGDHEQQELNFFGFSESFVGPSEADLESALGMEKGLLSVRCSQATLIEAAYWLSLGATIGYFPEATSVLAIRSIMSSPFLEAPSFLNDWGYILNPFMRSKVESWLGNPDTIGFETSFEHEESVRTLFNILIGHAGRFSRNKMAQAFIVLIDFFNRKDLVENLRDTPIFLEDISRSMDSGDAFNPETGEVLTAAVYVGFSIWLDHLNEFRNITEATKDCDWINPVDARKLLQLTARIQAWRFYGLSSDSLAVRDARHAVNSAISRGYSLAPDQAAELQEHTLGLIDFWERSAAQADGVGG